MQDTYPVTINDPKVTKKVISVLRTIKGTKTVEIKPILGAEDMSRFLQKAPGTFYFLGTRNPEKDCIYPNHSSKFKVDEDVLKYGSISLAMLALEFGAPTQQLQTAHLSMATELNNTKVARDDAAQISEQ